jgi:hypothetical protein
VAGFCGRYFSAFGVNALFTSCPKLFLVYFVLFAKIRVLFFAISYDLLEVGPVCMWTLPSNMTSEWTPRTCLRRQPEETETASNEALIGFQNGRPTVLMQAVLDALAPFAEARRAVADALSRFAGRYPGGSP